jgi:hypothetical protein
VAISFLAWAAEKVALGAAGDQFQQQGVNLGHDAGVVLAE